CFRSDSSMAFPVRPPATPPRAPPIRAPLPTPCPVALLITPPATAPRPAPDNAPRSVLFIDEQPHANKAGKKAAPISRNRFIAVALGARSPPFTIWYYMPPRRRADQPDYNRAEGPTGGIHRRSLQPRGGEYAAILPASQGHPCPFGRVGSRPDKRR